MTYDPQAHITVGQLIERLQQENPGDLVLVNGYEGGYQAPEVRRASVTRRWKAFCGPWDDCCPDDELCIGAVVVSRGEGER